MVDTVTLTGEINLGQIGVIMSIIGTGVAIYVKSRLDVQRLNITYAALEIKISSLEAKLDATITSLNALALQVASLQATASFSTDIGRAISQLRTNIQKNTPHD